MGRWVVVLVAVSGCRLGYGDATLVLETEPATCASTLRLVGDAACTDAIRLTPAETDSAGAAYFADPVAVDDQTSFTATLRVRLGGTGDGMTFVIHSDPRGPAAIGTEGGDLGLGGITPSVAVELDTYVNPTYNDPGSEGSCGADDVSPDHVGVDVDGDLESIGTAQVDFEMEDSPFFVGIRYDGASNVLSVTADPGGTAGPPLVSEVVDLARLGSEVWIGATAGTGCDVADHDILELRVTID